MGVVGPRGYELEPLSADRFGVHFTADAELRDLIERARALASHRIPNGDLADLMKLMVASFVKHEEKRKFGLATKARRASAEKKHSKVEESATPPGGASAPTAASICCPSPAMPSTSPARPGSPACAGACSPWRCSSSAR